MIINKTIHILIFLWICVWVNVANESNDTSTTIPSETSTLPNNLIDKLCIEPKATCVMPVQCPAHFHIGIFEKCKLNNGKKGICCTTGQNHTSNLIVGQSRSKLDDGIDPVTLNHIAFEGRKEAMRLHSEEARILTTGKGSTLREGSASYGHFRNTRVFGLADLTEVMNVANRALEIALATRAFKTKQGLTNEQLQWSMVQMNLRPTPLGLACSPILECPHIPDHYRRIDGSCNNLLNPTWGTALSPFARLLPPSYHDGVWLPRLSETYGKELPSARKISTTLLPDRNIPNPHVTLMLMQFGQFLGHDITHSIDTTFSNGSAISCCTDDGTEEIPAELRHYSCMPIKIPSDDPFYSKFNQRCLNFVRSIMAPRSDCTLGYAQQMNKVTHFIDGSNIYGSAPEHTREIRSFRGGKLNVFKDFGRELLPLSKDPEACITMEQGSACFQSGDSRTNQMITLVAVHTLFLREHNRIATDLYRLNPHWNDEKLFLETRNIIIAILQVITYKEFLPIILGEEAMQDFDIALQYDGYSTDYDQRIEPSITNEVAGAALRFGHSTVEGVLKIYGLTQMDEVISIPEAMFYPGRMRKHLFFDQILSTLTTEPIQDVDPYISETLTKYMFRGGNPFGVDLAALNIQRGRDHGLRPYNDYRELVGLKRIESFSEFGQFGTKLANVYSSVNDVDLFIGGLFEPKYAGAAVSLTFRDLIADQFTRLKKGDRYFFDHDPSVNPSHFTLGQLKELRKVTLSRVVCDNSDGYLLARQTPNAFRMPGVGNEFAECAGPSIPRINLRLWKEYV